MGAAASRTRGYTRELAIGVACADSGQVWGFADDESQFLAELQAMGISAMHGPRRIKATVVQSRDRMHEDPWLSDSLLLPCD